MNKTLKVLALALTSLLSVTAVYGQRQVADSIGLVRSLSNSPQDMILGKVSGVGVSNTDGSHISGKSLNIRGINSIRTNNQPLYIIDGIRISVDVNKHVDAFWQFDDKPYLSANNPLGIVALQDIRSIQVIKDASATALYGSDAANGVVIINTKPLVKGACVVDWVSNFGVEIPSVMAYGTSASFSHDHYLRINGKVGNTRYHASANFRSIGGAVSRERSNFGGINASIDSKSGEWLNFGFKLITGAGQQNRTSATAYLGGSSLMTDIRNSASKEVIDGWISSFDDGAFEYRAMFGAYANLKFAKMLKWENSVSADWMTNKRTIWYGKATDYGLKHNVTASMLTCSLLSYSAKSALKFDSYLFSDHHINITAGAEYIGKFNQYNTLNGQNMLTEELRGKALNYMNYHFFPHAYDIRQGTFGPFATLTYDCLGYAQLTAGARTEFSNKYADWAPTVLPTAALSVDLRKMIAPKSAVLSRLKLVGGVGASMIEDIWPYDFTGYFVTGDFYKPIADGGIFHDTVVKLYTQEWTAGVEAGFLNNTVNVGVKFYDRRTSDTFSIYRFGHTVEVSGVTMWNNGDRAVEQQQTSVIANRGIELDFDALLHRSKRASVKLYGTASYNMNCLLSSEEDFIKGLDLGNGYYNASAVGYPVGVFYGYDVDKDGNPIDMTGEGEITDADKIVLGSPIPIVRYSLGVEARWRAFRAEAMFAGAAGHKIYNLHEGLVEDGSYVRLERLGFGYNVPLKKKKLLKAINVIVGANNLFTVSNYSGYNPDVNSFGLSALSNGIDYGSYPLMRSVTAGVTLKF